ncbi:hypothetical protein [Mangrovibacter yixingensis]|uniref:hypothetical protein n=1 Tax=Mangrovibacter yixingensis TaxID=1529639 RepID=UPI001CFB3C53|nr:hypothetical protein [Mangrovibacter yixingensis]
MSKRIKFLVIFIVLVGGLVAYFTPVIKMELAESAQYTENDKREYNFYTPELLKKMPRIAEQYDFHFANISGPAAHIYSVTFYGTHDTSKIDDYLSSNGYKKQQSCNIEADCWQAGDPQAEITVSKLESPESLQVSLSENFPE